MTVVLERYSSWPLVQKFLDSQYHMSEYTLLQPTWLCIYPVYHQLRTSMYRSICILQLSFLRVLALVPMCDSFAMLPFHLP
ncbi:hypothetical protein RchiOBHm_Chr1g0381591 [Rosa chinensis]|uniref:Uncharacterized protein n=1 Tax=Rosa chinensis TaxID=74649 RepID=A0A2P6SP61_ROSCH|nr:hypothetical protein RchiOBHm_Chr1g0381591 [Rosa chinensis]